MKQSDEKNDVGMTTKKQDNDVGAEKEATVRPNYLTKLDLRLIPILGCTYTILFLDRTNSRSLLEILTTGCI